jgi:hypothetical protein
MSEDDQLSLTGDFRFVLIPVDVNCSIDILTGSKSGGLTNDYLVQYAKSYFQTNSNNNKKQTGTDAKNDSVVASQLRALLAGSSHVASLTDQQVLDLFGSHSNACDITAVTVPTPRNDYTAVSMYASTDNKDSINTRATQLLTACGHVTHGVRGPVFVGRARDNEAADCWERMDFVEADPQADWCRLARGPGGGGGSGRAAASSLSGLLSNQGQGQLQMLNNSNAIATPGASLFGLNGAPAVQESWGRWTQSDEEVEVKISLPTATKAKYVKVQFASASIRITVTGQTVLQGTLFDSIHVDDSTYTIANEGPTGREIVVTLAKKEAALTWAYLVKV